MPSVPLFLNSGRILQGIANSLSSPIQRPIRSETEGYRAPSFPSCTWERPVYGEDNFAVPLPIIPLIPSQFPVFFLSFIPFMSSCQNSPFPLR
jgi:hypothetical protein